MKENNIPLAYRMCPKTIDEYVGQEHILSKDKMLYRLIKADRLSSIILYGPPGCGKTSLARVIANTTKNKFEKINAVSAGVADIKRVVEDAQNLLLNPSGKAVLFIDEIHRFNKLQQDALLPYVENGTIILIGATTENPYFSVNKALISRSTVFKLEPLKIKDVTKVLQNAVEDKEKGLGACDLKIDEGVLEHIAELSGGDVRVALNALEIAALTTEMNADGDIEITKEIAAECIQKKAIKFDKTGDSHYDNISAFIKSMRGGDADAVLFYLARAIYAGEDPMFLARRIVICASEDVGMANSNALVVANAALQAIHQIGMPEARIILAHAATYVARSPKSNAAYNGINQALQDVETKDTGTIPMHIRNAPAEGMSDLGYGVGYKYPHDFPNHEVEQQYLPDAMLGTKYYIPDETEEKLK
ncbi:MAG: replication-associated recombination protein A [Clostridia bacterium]|nr:replication-associated recombination protein A [Clostridia bacterium]